jgi:menaquinone-dependent protoporphyrinogen IX oxidase
MNTLVVYYSLSGNTRTVATALAQRLSADIEEIRCGRYTRGFSGFIRACYDSWGGYLPPIEPLSHGLSRYELVVIGAPIWAWHPATPVRALLCQEASRLPTVAFLLTHGGAAAQQSLREMEQLAGRAAKASLVVREADIRSGRFEAAVSSFASRLQTKQAA